MKDKITIHVGGKPLEISTDGLFEVGILTRGDGATSIYVPKIGFITVDENEEKIQELLLEAV